MQVRRCGNDYGIHGGISQDFTIIESPLLDAKFLGGCFGRPFTSAVDPGDFCPRVLLEAAHQHLAIHPCADDPKLVFVHVNSAYYKTSESSRLGGLVYLFACVLVYLPNFFLNASVSAGTIWNRSPTTP